MKKLFIVASIGLLLTACNSSPKSSESKNAEGEMKLMIPKSGCFAYQTAQDSIWLKLEFFPNVVTGTLIYHLSEKDKNEGTLQGTIKGDTLIADYTFQSEGLTSVREVAFLVKKNTVIEGYGDMDMKNDTLRFRDTKNIDFSKGMTFERIDCAVNDKVFQMKR